MDKFLSDKRILVFICSLLGGIGSWFIGFHTWAEMLTPGAIGGLFGILASIAAANISPNAFKPAPTITETVSPKTTVTTTTTTPPADK
jgi:hypothetical protein